MVYRLDTNKEFQTEDERRAKQREWVKKHSREYECKCGSILNVLNLKQHLKSKKHKKYDSSIDNIKKIT